MRIQVKKNYLKWIFFLVWVFPAMFLNGCDYEQYNVEKLYWKANRLYQELAKNIKDAKPQDYQEAIDLLRKVTLRYPDWNNTPTAQLLIGRIYAAQNNKNQAKIEFEKILKNYPKNANVCTSALLGIGRIYEEQNDWNEALKCYNQVMDDYIYTYGAYQCSLHLVQYYKSKNQDAQAEAVYKEIFQRYEKFIKAKPNSSFALAAQHFVAAFLLDLKKWDEAVDYLKSLIATYPNSTIALRSLYTMATIYKDQLNQPDNAIKIYQELIDKYPKSERAKLALEQIEAIKTEMKR